MIYKFPGNVRNGDVEKIEIEASTLEEAIKIYNEKYPQWDFNKAVERRLKNGIKQS